MPEFTIEPSADSELDSSLLTTNKGSATTLMVGFTAAKGGKAQRAILRFSLSQLPAGATVTAATLTIRYTDLGGNEAAKCKYITTHFNAWTESEVTWDSAKQGFQPWTTPGGDSDATDEADWNLSALHPPDSIRIIDVKALVERSVSDGRADLNVLLKRDFEQDLTNFNTFIARDDGTSANRPKLTVIYAFDGIIPLLC